MELKKAVLETNMKFANETIAVLKEYISTEDELIAAFKRINDAYVESVIKTINIATDYSKGRIDI